jgi:DNA repair protein RadA/Sms
LGTATVRRTTKHLAAVDLKQRINVAGGLRINEPAADLAAAAALVSSLTGAILPHNAVYFGEIALSGAIRPVAHAAARFKESAKLGFQGAIAPASGLDGLEPGAIHVKSCAHIGELVADIAAQGVQRAAKKKSNAEPEPFPVASSGWVVMRRR